MQCFPCAMAFIGQSGTFKTDGLDEIAANSRILQYLVEIALSQRYSEPIMADFMVIF